MSEERDASHPYSSLAFHQAKVEVTSPSLHVKRETRCNVSNTEGLRRGRSNPANLGSRRGNGGISKKVPKAEGNGTDT